MIKECLNRVVLLQIAAGSDSSHAMSCLWLPLQISGPRECVDLIVSHFVSTGEIHAAKKEATAEMLLSRDRFSSEAREKREVERHVLRPDEGEEAFEMLVMEVDFVEAPVMLFIRLATPTDLGCEGKTPVRFLLVVLTSEDKQASETNSTACSLCSQNLALTHTLTFTSPSPPRSHTPSPPPSPKPLLGMISPLGFRVSHMVSPRSCSHRSLNQSTFPSPNTTLNPPPTPR